MERWRLSARDLLLVLAVALLTDVALSLFWTCDIVGEQANNRINQHPHCGALSGPIAGAVQWLFASETNPAIAIFTAALVISTVLLWLATNKAANAAKRSADAAQRSADIAQSGLNPYLLPVIQVYALSDQGDTNALIRYPVDRPTIEYLFRNFGRSPAILNRIRVAFEPSPQPPSEPNAANLALPANRIVPADKQTRDWNTKLKSLGNDVRRDLYEQKTFLWFHGLVEFEDVFGADYVTEFCWRYDARQDHLAPYNGDRKRNKCTRKT